MNYSFNDERSHIQLYYDGDAIRAYDFFGSHVENWDGKQGVVFRVWAPNAKSVSVVGDFNGWDQDANHMYKIDDGGIWEVFRLPGVRSFSKPILMHSIARQDLTMLPEFSLLVITSGRTRLGTSTKTV